MDWGNLLDAVETEEVRVRQEPVDVPEGVVALLEKLRDQTGPNGGGMRATLPVLTVGEFEHAARVLRKASDMLTPPMSVYCKAVYRDGDTTTETYESTKSDGTVVQRKRTVVVDGAEPIKISFTVGTRRGRKTDESVDGDGQADLFDETAGEEPASVVDQKPTRGRRKN